MVQLARATEGLTGSEIENVFVDAMLHAFYEDVEPTDLTIAQILVDFVPLSKLMAEQITGLRNWAKDRARSQPRRSNQMNENSGRLRRELKEPVSGRLFFSHWLQSLTLTFN